MIETGGTFVEDAELGPFVGGGHEGQDAAEVVGVQVVLVKGTLDRVVELRQVVGGHHPVELPQLAEVLLSSFPQLSCPRQPLLDGPYGAVQAFDGVLDVYDEFLCLFCFESA